MASAWLGGELPSASFAGLLTRSALPDRRRTCPASPGSRPRHLDSERRLLTGDDLAGFVEDNAIGTARTYMGQDHYPATALRATCTATAPEAVRTFRTDATGRIYPLSTPNRPSRRRETAGQEVMSAGSRRTCPNSVRIHQWGNVTPVDTAADRVGHPVLP